MALARQSEGLKAGVAEPFPLSLERELGAVANDHGTQFAIWAPSAKSVTLRFFTKGSSMEDGDAMVGAHRPELQSDGAWTIHFDGNLHGTYYDYLVEQQDGNRVRTADPWAKGAGVNGRRSMVVDLARTDPAGWEHDTHPITPLRETMVAEMHVASFSANPHGGFPLEHRGKYLAFTDLGTTVDGKGEFPTGVDYFKQLGVTAIQLLPFYDYGSVDENDPRQYNWGYDPLNYNVPEGSYSTNPFDGTVRITECKQMIQSLHAQGFKVIMDVVYNHMYTADNWFERVVSGYFVRRNADGTLSNGSGCGDDMASERAMMRRYIVDSVTYWAREYHIDEVKVDGDNATATVVLTCKKFDAFAQALTEATTALAEDGQTAELDADQINEKVGQLVLEALGSVEPTESNPVELPFARTDNAWGPASGAEQALSTALFSG